MAAFNFPNSPSTNDLHTENGVTYKWNGTVWKRQNASYTDATNLNVTGISTFAGTIDSNSTLEVAGIANFDSTVKIADKIEHLGDSNTNIRFPAADTFAVETNGTEKLRIVSNGKMGLGTNNPTQYFHVVGNSASVQTEESGGGIVRMQSGGSVGYVGTYSNHPLLLQVNSQEKLRIDSSGRVLIGTTVLGSTSADGLTVAASGNAGITVRSGTSNSGNLFFSDGNSGNSNFRGYVQYLHSSNALLFGTNAGERLRITSSGDVCIGATAPVSNEKLYVLNGSAISGRSIDPLTAVLFESAECRLQLQSDNTGNNASTLILSNDNKHWMVQQRATNQSNRFQIGYVSGTATDLSNQSSDYFTITTDGKVGINEVSNINGRLHVQHDAANENILYATRYDDQGNDKPILAITEAQMTGMGSSGLIIGNHNRDIHIGAVFDSSAAVTTTATAGIRIMSTGRTYWGTTSPIDGNSHIAIHTQYGASGCGVEIKHTGNQGSNRDFIRFYNKNNAEAGSIEHTSTTGTAFQTSSDHRLKENVVDITDGIERLKLLKPRKFSWIDDPELGLRDGFIAHEVSPVIPHCVSGEKDAVKEDGSIQTQTMEYSQLTPLLTAALQEAIAEIEILKAEVAALKSS
tara:strand:- start:79 stop:1974 length:1896 start_codon:yes stop_codon:yes gene_type:complete